MTRVFAITCALLASAATDTAAQTLSLSPSVIQLRGAPGQSTTQTFTMTNSTSLDLTFELVAQDVVVRGGARAFTAAGETAGSIAARAVFSEQTITVPAGQRRSVKITVTVPTRTEHRAIVARFRGITPIPGTRAVATASLGALLTFTLSDDVSLTSSDLAVTPQSASSNAAFEQSFLNDGGEPVVSKGIAAVLDERGVLVARIEFEQKRILPNERVAFRTEYPGELKSGTYRVVSTFDFEGRVVSRSAALIIP